MKSIVPLLGITVLAALALVGCDQNGPGNSSLNDTNSTIGGITNAPATNSLPNAATNMPAGTNQ